MKIKLLNANLGDLCTNSDKQVNTKHDTLTLLFVLFGFPTT